MSNSSTTPAAQALGHIENNRGGGDAGTQARRTHIFFISLRTREAFDITDTSENNLCYLSLEDGGSELVLKNLDRVSSMELKAWTVEMRDEEARILLICQQTLPL